MVSNLEKYRKEVDGLIVEGALLRIGLRNEMGVSIPKESFGDLSKEAITELKKATFRDRYQKWYNSSLAAVKQFLPDRVEDFVSAYHRDIKKGNAIAGYGIEDYLLGLVLTSYSIERNHNIIIRKFDMQFEIVNSLPDRLDSSLFEIQQLVEADLFDSEIDAAAMLAKRGFLRAAGAVCGVVLEKHLKSVAASHGLKISKKAPSINDLNELLKNNDIIDLAQWRHLQYMGDLRNICDHDKTPEPTASNLDDLISGVKKVLKTVY